MGNVGAVLGIVGNGCAVGAGAGTGVEVGTAVVGNAILFDAPAWGIGSDWRLWRLQPDNDGDAVSIKSRKVGWVRDRVVNVIRIRISGTAITVLFVRRDTARFACMEASG